VVTLTDGVVDQEVKLMAVYEFECAGCGERFEINKAMGEHDSLKEQPPTCPKCGQAETHQLVSLFGCKTPSG
jgi:putative FmdB family regulatory protein